MQVKSGGNDIKLKSVKFLALEKCSFRQQTFAEDYPVLLMLLISKQNTRVVPPHLALLFAENINNHAAVPTPNGI